MKEALVAYIKQISKTRINLYIKIVLHARIAFYNSL